MFLCSCLLEILILFTDNNLQLLDLLRKSEFYLLAILLESLIALDQLLNSRLHLLLLFLLLKIAILHVIDDLFLLLDFLFK